MTALHHTPLPPVGFFQVVMNTELGDVSIVGYEGGISRIEFMSPLSALIRGEYTEKSLLNAKNDTPTINSNSLPIQTNTGINKNTLQLPEAIDALVLNTVAAINGEPFADAIPLRLEGTSFQQAVWECLRTIPAGSTRTYAEIARAIQAPRAHRAVANACGANRVAVLIPCHRAVRSDGSSGGYRWGRERKRALLEREAIYGPSDASLACLVDSTGDQR
jgi:O-6-methylguanine DNA methyltransferase